MESGIGSLCKFQRRRNRPLQASSLPVGPPQKIFLQGQFFLYLKMNPITNQKPIPSYGLLIYIKSFSRVLTRIYIHYVFPCLLGHNNDL